VSLVVVQAGHVSTVGKKVVLDDAVSALSFSPDGRLLAVGSDDTSVCVCDTMSWEKIQTIEGQHSGSILALSWEPAGARLAIGSSDGTASVVETRSWSLLGAKHAVHVQQSQPGQQTGHIEGVHDKVLMSLQWGSDGDCSYLMDAQHMPVLLEHVAATDASVARQLTVAAATPPPATAASSNRRYLNDDDDAHWSDQVRCFGSLSPHLFWQ